jgi:hypothetical protein
VGVQAADDVRGGPAEDEVAHRGAGVPVEPDVAMSGTWSPIARSAAAVGPRGSLWITTKDTSSSASRWYMRMAWIVNQTPSKSP